MRIRQFLLTLLFTLPMLALPSLAQAESSYFLFQPDAASQNLSVISLEGPNVLQVGNTRFNLALGEKRQFAPGSLSSSGLGNFTRLIGNGDFAVGSSAKGSDLPLPSAFLGSDFVVPQQRNYHQLIFFSPYANANLRINRAGVITSLTVTAGTSQTFLAGNNNTAATLIQSDQPIGVYHRGYTTINNWLDVFPLPPASKNLVGIRTGTVRIAAYRDNTQVTVVASDGSSVQYQLNQAQQQTINIGVNTSQGRGSSLRIFASQPIAAAQINDGDGSEATAFWPQAALASYFMLPVDAQYLAVACPSANTQLTFTPAGKAAQSVNCGGSATLPGKAYFGLASNGAHLPAGSSLTASAPIAVIYEDDIYSAERNLAGKAFGYWFIDPQTQNTTVDIFSLVNQNSIATDSQLAAGTAALLLNAGASAAIVPGVQLAPGRSIWGSGPFTLSSAGNPSSTNGSDQPIPPELLGTQFVVPHVGALHRYYLLSPLGDARVTVLVGSVQSNLTLTEGVLTTFEAGNNNNVSARFFSTAPIALYHLGHNGGTQRNAVFAVPPASPNVFGVHSNTVIGALYNNTHVQITTSDGAVFPLVMQAGDKLQPNLGVALTQNQDVALNISADAPIAAMAHNDGDGSDATAFWPANYFKTHYRLPTNAQYAAIVCTQPNTQITFTQITGTQTTGTDISNHSCSSNGAQPGKVYLGSSLNGASINKGSLIAATQPIYVVYEDSVNNDERNLWGANLAAAPVVPNPTTAAASFGGTLTQNTQWIAGVNYQANNHLIVPAGITATVKSGAVIDMTAFNLTVQGKLLIEAGATLKFSKTHYLLVKGDGLLSTTGSSAQPVIFTSNSPTPVIGDWAGIRPQDRGRLEVRYARIEYADVAVLYSTAQISGYVKHSTLQNNGYAVMVTYAPLVTDLVFAHNVFGNNRSGAVNLTSGGHPTFHYNQFIDNGAGKGFGFGDNVTISGHAQINNQDDLLDFRFNWWNTTDVAKFRPSLRDAVASPGNNALVDYRGYRLVAAGQETDPNKQLLGYISSNLTLSGTPFTILNRLTVLPTATLTIATDVQSYAPWQIQGNVIVSSSGSITQQNVSSLVTTGTLRFAAGSRYFGYNTPGYASTHSFIQMIDNSQLIVSGTATAPVLFSSTLPAPTQGSWGGISLNGDAVVQINYATIENANTGLRYSDRIRGSVTNSLFQKNTFGISGYYCLAVNDFTVTNNRFANHTLFAIYLTGGGYPTFNFNQFAASGTAHLQINGSGLPESTYPRFIPINFRYNWWGSDDSLLIENQIIDIADGPRSGSHFLADYSGYRRSPDGNETDPQTQLLGRIAADRILPAGLNFEVLSKLLIDPNVTLTIEGNVDSVQTWDIQGSVVVKENAVITQRAVKNLEVYGALVFEAGTTFKAAATAPYENFHTAIVNRNNGQIIVNGTAERPATFTSIDAPNNYYWNGFVLADTSTATIQHAHIKNAHAGLRYQNTPSASIQNSTFSDSNYGVRSFGGNPSKMSFINNHFQNTGYANVSLQNAGFPQFKRNLFTLPRYNNYKPVQTANYAVDAPAINATQNCFLTAYEEKDIADNVLDRWFFFMLRLVIDGLHKLTNDDQRKIKNEITKVARTRVTGNVDVSNPEILSDEDKCGGGSTEVTLSDGQFTQNTEVGADQELLLTADGLVSAGVTLTVNGLLNTDGHDLTVNGNLVLTDSARALLPLTANLIIGPSGSLTLASGSVLTFEQGKLDIAATASFTAQGSADNRAILNSSSTTPWAGVVALGQLNLNYLAIIGAQRGLTLGNGARGTIANTQILYNDMGLVLSGNTSAVNMQTTAIAAKPSTGSGTRVTVAAVRRR